MELMFQTLIGTVKRLNPATALVEALVTFQTLIGTVKRGPVALAAAMRAVCFKPL